MKAKAESVRMNNLGIPIVQPINDRPVISTGCSRPSNSSKVGAISASEPSFSPAPGAAFDTFEDSGMPYDNMIDIKILM